MHEVIPSQAILPFINVVGHRWLESEGRSGGFVGGSVRKLEGGHYQGTSMDNHVGRRCL